MLKLLRHPVSLVVLTCLVTTWTILAAASGYPFRPIFGTWFASENTPECDYFEGDVHRPIYEFVRWSLGRPPLLSFDAGLSSDRDNCAIKTNEGLFVLHRDIHDPIENKNPIEGMVRLSGTARYDEFGLFAGVITRQRTTVEIVPMRGWQPLTLDEVSRAYNTLHAPGSAPVVGGVQTRWTIKPLAAAHDFVYLTTLLAWLYALISIAKWKLWNRNKNPACPHCAYDLTNLNSTICPECGNALPNSLSQREVAHESGK